MVPRCARDRVAEFTPSEERGNPTRRGKGLTRDFLCATMDEYKGVAVSENNQTNPGMKSLIIGAGVLAACVFSGLVLINFLRSSSPDIWAPFILLFVGFAFVILILSIVGLGIGIGQVEIQRKKGDKPDVITIGGIVLNSLVLSIPVILLLISLIK